MHGFPGKSGRGTHVDCKKIMGNVIILITAGLGVGFLAGFLIAKFHYKDDTSQKHLEDLQAEYKEYRESVREHFVDTVDLLSDIDKAQQKLYRTVASGVRELCSNDENSDGLLTQTVKTLAKPGDSDKEFDQKTKDNL